MHPEKTNQFEQASNRAQNQAHKATNPKTTAHMATVVSFKYEGNSELLKGIYEAIERGIIN